MHECSHINDKDKTIGNSEANLGRVSNNSDSYKLAREIFLNNIRKKTCKNKMLLSYLERSKRLKNYCS